MKKTISVGCALLAAVWSLGPLSAAVAATAEPTISDTPDPVKPSPEAEEKREPERQLTVPEGPVPRSPFNPITSPGDPFGLSSYGSGVATGCADRSCRIRRSRDRCAARSHRISCGADHTVSRDLHLPRLRRQHIFVECQQEEFRRNNREPRVKGRIAASRRARPGAVGTRAISYASPTVAPTTTTTLCSEPMAN